jgi:hypothetical protein
MLYPPLIILTNNAESAATYDYPKLKAGNAIADSTVWVALPARFSKDNYQVEGTLFGNASRDANGLQVPDYVSGMAWDRPAGFASALTTTGETTFIWQGIPQGFDAWASFISIKNNAGTNWRDGYDAISFGRDGSSSSGRLFERNSDSTLERQSSESGFIATDTQSVQYAVTVAADETRFYIDGVSHSVTSSLAPFMFTGDGKITVCNRSIADPGEGVISGNVTFLMVCDRALSAAELASLITDPNQILA